MTITKPKAFIAAVATTALAFTLAGCTVTPAVDPAASPAASQPTADNSQVVEQLAGTAWEGNLTGPAPDDTELNFSLNEDGTVDVSSFSGATYDEPLDVWTVTDGVASVVLRDLAFLTEDGVQADQDVRFSVEVTEMIAAVESGEAVALSGDGIATPDLYELTVKSVDPAAVTPADAEVNSTAAVGETVTVDDEAGDVWSFSITGLEQNPAMETGVAPEGSKFVAVTLNGEHVDGDFSFFEAFDLTLNLADGSKASYGDTLEYNVQDDVYFAGDSFTGARALFVIPASTALEDVVNVEIVSTYSGEVVTVEL